MANLEEFPSLKKILRRENRAQPVLIVRNAFQAVESMLSEMKVNESLLSQVEETKFIF